MNHSNLFKASIKARSMHASPLADSSLGKYGSSTPVESSRKPGTSRQQSKSPTRVCLCAPTQHPGSFRCRFHRGQSAKTNKDRQPAIPPARPQQPLKDFTQSSSPLPTRNVSAPRRGGRLGPSRLSKVTTAALYADEETTDEGPYRFLKFAAGAGAAAVAAGGAALAWRKSHGGAPDDLLSKLGPDAPPAAAAGTLHQAASYDVQKGDSLSSIARNLGTTVEVLRESNALKGDTILPGQKLWVPKTHTIQKGDTLFKIAKEYKTTVGDILKVNSISNPDQIFPGDILLLP